MYKVVASVMAIVAFALPAQSVMINDHKQYKDTAVQKIRSGDVWQDLKFSGKAKTIDGNGNRSLYCMQVALSMNGENPQVVKLRFARHLPNGKLDTTGTNTYTDLGVVSSAWYASPCWEILSVYPVSVQIKVIGNSKYYYSPERQFKMWTPGANFPLDFPVPEATPMP